MEVEHTDALQRARNNMQPPPKELTPAKVQQTISVGALFSRQQNEIISTTKYQQSAVKTTKSVAKGLSNAMARLSKIRSSSQSPHKVAKSLEKKSDMHPLAVAFKSTSAAIV